MLDLTHLFAGAAWAAETSTAIQPGADVTSSLMRFLPLVLIFAVFYFLLIRPQQKKLEEHAALTKALKKGDKVITGGGIMGTVVKAENDEYVMVEIADGVQVKVARATVSGLVEAKNAAKTPPADAKKK